MQEPAKPLMLGYSPLPGTLIGTTSGQVALSPEQELAERYKPQLTEGEKQRQEQESIQQQQEQQDLQSVQDELAQRQAIRKAELEQKFGKQRKSMAGPFTAEELEALGIPVAEKKAAPQYKATEHPENKGFVLDEQGQPQLADIAQGGTKFKTKAQADQMKGNLADYKTVQMPGGGFVLSPKTDAELAKEGASKLSYANVSAPGMPMAAHELIASNGGLNADAAKNANVSQQRVGNRYLVAGQGKGLSADQVRDLLESHGYLDPETSNDNQALQLISDSAKNPKYTPEGYEQVANIQREQEAAAAEKENAAQNLIAPEAPEMGYPTTAEDIAADHVRRAQEQGIDVEDIMHSAAVATQGMPNHVYHDRVTNDIRAEMSKPVNLQSAEKGEESQPFATAEEKKMEKELTGKNMLQVAQYAVDKAPNAFYKFVAKKVLNKLNALQSAGVKFSFDVQGGGSRRRDLREARGITVTNRGQNNEATQIHISLNGAAVMKNQQGYPSGMNYRTMLHELLHAATASEFYSMGQDHPFVREMNDLRNIVVREHNKQLKDGTLPQFMKDYARFALENPSELLTWGMTDERMQDWLSKIKVGDKTVFDKIVELIRNMMGISKNFETALDRLVRTSQQIVDTDIHTLANGMKAHGYYLGDAKPEVKAKPKNTPSGQISLFQKENVPRSNLAKGQAGIDLLDSIGRGEKAPEPSAFAKMKSNIEDMSKEEKVGFFKEQARKFDNFIGNKFFSSDYALQSELKSQLERAGYKAKEILGMMLHLSTSQAVNANGVANAALHDGGVKYNEDLHKWQTFKSDDNMPAVIKKIHQLGEKYGISGEDAQRIFHVATEAARTQELNARNADLDRQIKAAKTQAEAAALERKKKNTRNMDAHEIAVGMKMFEIYPELKEAVKTWNGTRKHGLDAMVEGGLYTREEAELLLDSAAYVPFFREDQIEAGKGPKEVVNSLRVAADKRMKGSEKPVNDIMDNMVRWTQYAISRSVRAKSARILAEAAVEHNLGNEVFDAKKDPNVIKIWDKGRERFFKLEDPLWVEAFTGLESVALPMVGFASKVSGILRDSIVMYPVFSVAQVPQDSFAAMFSSGLKPQYALRIPALAIKEFIQTLRGKSTTHEKLKSFGVSGLFDSTAESIRKNFEDSYGLSSNPNLKNRVRKILGDIATASDNSVRQAVYEASLQQGLSEAEAIEKSFEIFNPHRRGTSKELAIASKLIPFFNAYIAVQHVAYKTLTGKGVSPSQREEALKTLAATSTSVFLMSFLYAALNADDDDYLRKPTPTRDRLLMIPGTGGASIPIRADMFSLPKILGEHVYLLMTDNGYEDPAKFRASMSSALMEAVTSPTVLPQVIKPIVETSINYDFFQKKPIVGIYQQKEETERQFDSTTSEFAKLLGKTGAISPLAADHLIRGFFGSTGGLMLYMTNPMIAAATGQPRPDISMSDAVATLPGMSGFMEKSYESALRHDFYQLREATGKAAYTMADIKKNSPEELADYLADPTNKARLALNPRVNMISSELTKIRDAIKQIGLIPDDKMSSEERGRRIDQLRNQEEQILKSVNLKQMREQAEL
jgi:uncharacterized protein YcgL (UPF0745 family)